MNKKVIIGSDHAGFDAKKELISYLTGKGFECTDAGTYSSFSCDYPVPAHNLCKRIQSGEFEKGILICGTGIGVSIAANKHDGIRAALCSDLYSTELTRQHNDANVCCMGARILDISLICDIAYTFLTTEALAEERHIRRRQMLSELEDGSFDEKYPQNK